MVNELDQHELMVLNEFLGNNWDKFVSFAEDFDMTEAQCDDLSDKLEKAAGMG